MNTVRCDWAAAVGHDHLRRIVEDNNLWTMGDSRASVTVSGATVVHTEDGSGVFASCGRSLDRLLRVQTLPLPPASYPVDPRRPPTTTVVEEDWAAFSEDRPDYVPAGSTALS